MANIVKLQKYGNGIAVLLDDGSRVLCYKGVGGLWYPHGTPTPPPSGLHDYYTTDPLGGTHGINNPGGTIESGWEWHISSTETGGDPSTGRGGDDLHYNFETFYAPAAGTVRHFDVSGVGMCVLLNLDTPLNRTGATYTNEAAGQLVTVWHEHCSASYDGHVNQGDPIGISGDGYGAYPAHLHVHGLVDNGNSAGSSNRVCPWNFM